MQVKIKRFTSILSKTSASRREVYNSRAVEFGVHVLLPSRRRGSTSRLRSLAPSWYSLWSMIILLQDMCTRASQKHWNGGEDKMLAGSRPGDRSLYLWVSQGILEHR